MTRRKDTITAAARQALERGDIADRIARKSEFLRRVSSDPACPARRREEYERRLLAAFAALEPPAWIDSVGLTSLVRIFDSATRFLRNAETTVEVEVARAMERIHGVMDDPYAPDEWHGRRPDADLVRSCILTWDQKRGRPAAGEQPGGKYAALHALLVQLGISNASTPEAVKVQLARLARRRR